MKPLNTKFHNQPSHPVNIDWDVIGNKNWCRCINEFNHPCHKRNMDKPQAHVAYCKV